MCTAKSAMRKRLSVGGKKVKGMPMGRDASMRKALLSVNRKRWKDISIGKIAMSMSLPAG